ncbi:MAG: hypothetical protein M3Z09_00765 [Acidobacteriota bacterium]|nr:hypothetical protein [Acidobacteriota bacterium]
MQCRNHVFGTITSTFGWSDNAGGELWQPGMVPERQTTFDYYPFFSLYDARSYILAPGTYSLTLGISAGANPAARSETNLIAVTGYVLSGRLSASAVAPAPTPEPGTLLTGAGALGILRLALRNRVRR